MLVSAQAPITPNFLSGSSGEIDVGPPLFTLLKLEMPTDGARSGWCDQPLSNLVNQVENM